MDGPVADVDIGAPGDTFGGGDFNEASSATECANASEAADASSAECTDASEAADASSAECTDASEATDATDATEIEAMTALLFFLSETAATAPVKKLESV